MDGNVIILIDDMKLHHMLPTKILDENINIARVKKYFSPEPWQTLKVALSSKRNIAEWICTLRYRRSQCGITGPHSARYTAKDTETGTEFKKTLFYQKKLGIIHKVLIEDSFTAMTGAQDLDCEGQPTVNYIHPNLAYHQSLKSTESQIIILKTMEDICFHLKSIQHHCMWKFYDSVMLGLGAAARKCMIVVVKGRRLKRSILSEQNLEPHSIEKRGFFEGLEFQLEAPSVDWRRELGTTNIGAPLSGHLKIYVHDEVYARLHLGIIGKNFDIVQALLCFKGETSYNINILQKLYEAVTVIVPENARIIFKSLEDIVDGITTIIKDPIGAIAKLGKGVIQLSSLHVLAMELNTGNNLLILCITHTFITNHIKVIFNKDGGAVDPTGFMTKRGVKLQPWYQECDDYKLVFMVSWMC
ncbi:unnamed protein product [Mytilus edulis]|uniref:Uncharacterized protein n=1 Tax=Mytilus edulis TaxID=6550 RepID=A0A8S3Q652_MYTED|nr:unnamed protein product [Mytilus edulis]